MQKATNIYIVAYKSMIPFSLIYVNSKVTIHRLLVRSTELEPAKATSANGSGGSVNSNNSEYYFYLSSHARRTVKFNLRIMKSYNMLYNCKPQPCSPGLLGPAFYRLCKTFQISFPDVLSIFLSHYLLHTEPPYGLLRIHIH